MEIDWLGLTLPPTGTDSVVQNAGNVEEEEEEENTPSLHLLQLGGNWWPSLPFFHRHSTGVDDYYYGHHYPPDIDIAYHPDGKILILKTWSDVSDYVPDLPDVPPLKPNSWSKLSLCATMEERCAVLQEFGAEVYTSADECKDVPKTLEEGIERGKRYEQLLKKMESREYATSWMDEL